MLQLTVTSICSIGFAHKLIALTETMHASMCDCVAIVFYTLSQLNLKISSQTIVIVVAWCLSVYFCRSLGDAIVHLAVKLHEKRACP